MLSFPASGIGSKNQSVVTPAHRLLSPWYSVPWPTWSTYCIVVRADLAPQKPQRTVRMLSASIYHRQTSNFGKDVI